MISPKPSCHYCKRDDDLLALLNAPGIFYICDECIKKQEEKTNMVAVLFYSSGLKFVSHEEAVLLELDNKEDDKS